MEKFVERLKELRLERELSKEQVSKDTGLSRSAISLWEAGKRVPNAEAVVVLAKYFEVTTDFLLGVDN